MSNYQQLQKKMATLSPESKAIVKEIADYYAVDRSKLMNLANIFGASTNLIGRVLEMSPTNVKKTMSKTASYFKKFEVRK